MEASEPVTSADGSPRPHHRESTRELETIFGTVIVRRSGHGDRGKETLFPLDASLNLPKDRYSLGVRRRAAEEAAKGSFDEAVAALVKYTGAKVPKRQLEELVVRAAQDFDSFYVAQRASWDATEHPASEILVLTFDGKGVAVRREDLREATRAAADKRNRKLEKRLSKGEKRNSKRMAEVAAVYSIAPFVRTPEQVLGDLRPEDGPAAPRPRPDGKRVWASLEKDPGDVIDEAFLDALSRDPGRERKWVVLVDGNKDHIKHVRAAARRHGVEVTIVIDVIHVLEYLWAAAPVFHEEGTPELEAWVTERLLWLLCGEAGQVAAAIRRSATKRGLSPEQRKAADRCANYIAGFKQYMPYDRCLEEGLPFATGVIEGACRHLVRDRIEITGARWSLAGAEAVLRIRSLRSSGDFDAYWKHHEQMEYERNHQAKYQDGKAPELKSPAEATAPTKTRGPLRLVK